jgi:hypothetical protein
MRGFGSIIAVKASLKAPVGAAIGMDHQDDPLGGVQAHGFANLFQDKFAIGFEVG